MLFDSEDIYKYDGVDDGVGRVKEIKERRRTIRTTYFVR